jgi:hypothetical protein
MKGKRVNRRGKAGRILWYRTKREKYWKSKGKYNKMEERNGGKLDVKQKERERRRKESGEEGRIKYREGEKYRKEGVGRSRFFVLKT